VVPTAPLGPLAAWPGTIRAEAWVFLLGNAVLRIARAGLGVFSVLVDAKDDAAQGFTLCTASRDVISRSQVWLMSDNRFIGWKQSRECHVVWCVAVQVSPNQR
jgi:hypothetical protein